ncbi:transglycosylase domain-containing protein [Parvularcula marina]|uniref:transglycosylase domain-containing protein n=1 Tax=Parvularcula marina TaxID=2292771 RepID=UPI003518BDCA
MANGSGRKGGTSSRKTSSTRRRQPARRRTPAARKTNSKSTTKSRAKKSTASSSARRKTSSSARRRTAARKGAGSAGFPLFRQTGRLFLRATTAAFFLLAAGLVTLLIYGRGLPPVGDLASARKEPRVEIHAANGEVIGIRGQDRGQPIDAASLPPHVVGAFLATEDRNFYHHVGVNPVAIIRALMVNVKAGDVEQGGSTITQQLVKNLLLTPEQSLHRKVQEMLLALKIEAMYSKDEILSFYLNAVYFGNGAYGLEAASRRYFDKRPEELSIGEAAVLAGLLKAPSRFAPTADENKAISRAKVVLAAMVDAGVITHAEAKAVSFTRLADIAETDHAAAYAADYALAEATRILGGVEQDLLIETTIDLPATRSAATAREEIATKDDLYTPEVQAAAIVLDENGAIHVLIGGNDYRQSSFNRAVQAKRQPGSAFKPFIYLTALEEGFRPEDMINDKRIEIGDWAPKNYKDTYAGMVPLSEAMARSLNAAAIRLQEEVGRENVVEIANRLGLKIDDPGPSLALGTVEVTPLELATAYLPLSGGGVVAEPFIITRISAADGTELYHHEIERVPRLAVSPDVLVPFDHMMREVVTNGSGRRAKIAGHYAAGKTGTSQSSRDAWFAGYASGLVGVVWLGRDDDRPMGSGHRAMSGSHAPAEWWSSVMTAALTGVPAREPTPYAPEPRSDKLLSHLAAILGVRAPRERQGPPPANIEDIISGEAGPDASGYFE